MDPKGNIAENMNIKISTNNMTRAIKLNVKFLEGFLTNAKADVKPYVSNIVDMYKDRKISNITTAENMILKLRTIQASTKNKVLKQYDKLIKKYENNEPLNVRMKVNKEKNTEKRVVVKKTNAAGKIQKLFKSFIKSKYAASYLVDVLLYSANPANPQQKPYKGVYLMDKQHIDVRAPNPFPQDIYKVLVKQDQQKKEFKKGINIFMTDENFKQWMNNHVSDGVVAFKIISYETLGDSGKKYNPLDEGLTDATNVSCNFNYIETKINLDKKTFLEAIKNERYKDNECWINTITDYYGDTLMNTNKKRNVLTRDKLLAILNKTEETVKLGISVKDVLPFFLQYRLSLRVFDVFGKMICRHDPETRNHNN